ncbi:hypothetical protein [Streptomyces minutiscleroticus]|uniref:hypothetical protein n=1 Tax=Streptomyces minutiscleroticus TaxID=68238 RepID=UPI003D9E2756
MPDRSLRLLSLLPSPAAGPAGAPRGEGRDVLLRPLPALAGGATDGMRSAGPGAVPRFPVAAPGGFLMRERPAAPSAGAGGGGKDGHEGSGSGDGADSGSGGGRDAAGGRPASGDRGGREDNPFAPPPEGTPDRPWQPRRPADGSDRQDGGEGGRSPWGSQWSDRQPGRSTGGGFGDRPGGPGERPGGQGGPEGGPGTGMRWDPTDPAQRRARYALLSGMWAFFFALFSWSYVALLLGALALYWGVSALRAKPRTPDPTAPAPAVPAARPQTTAAVSGLVTAALALALVASTFAAQLVYRDYYTCVNDALTNSAKQSCDEHLPEQLRDLLGTRG